MKRDIWFNNNTDIARATNWYSNLGIIWIIWNWLMEMSFPFAKYMHSCQPETINMGNKFSFIWFIITSLFWEMVSTLTQLLVLQVQYFVIVAKELEKRTPIYCIKKGAQRWHIKMMWLDNTINCLFGQPFCGPKVYQLTFIC